MASYGVKITGTGSYLPEKVLTNADLEKIVETSDEWIRTRTGICERHIAADDQPTSALGEQAALQALDAAGLTPEDIDLIIFGTVTPDQQFPNTACFLQARIGASNAACFSLEAACSGFIYSLDVASSMIRSGRFKRALVVGGEKLSSIVDWTDRSTCVLFGDGAGAFVLEACDPSEDSFVSTYIMSDGNYTNLLQVPAGGSMTPLTEDNINDHLQFLKMEGQGVFKLAVQNMLGAAKRVLADADMTIDDIRWVVPHQANRRIIEAIGKRLKVAEDNCYINVDRTGNTSAATIPVAIDEIAREGLIKSGEYILSVAFGGGFTWGATLIRWP